MVAPALSGMMLDAISLGTIADRILGSKLSMESKRITFA
jgi:hypothetical protein